MVFVLPSPALLLLPALQSPQEARLQFLRTAGGSHKMSILELVVQGGDDLFKRNVCELDMRQSL